MRGRVQGNTVLISALAALFWALNPVQTQAVTYIVQRMASLAAMFSIIGMWCFLKARLLQSHNPKKKFLYYVAVLFAFLLALGAKENAILLPASLVLIELFFFRETLKLSKQNIAILALGFFLSCFLPSFSKDPIFYTEYLHPTPLGVSLLFSGC